jgi:hypothetical protein
VFRYQCISTHEASPIRQQLTLRSSSPVAFRGKLRLLSLLEGTIPALRSIRFSNLPPRCRSHRPPNLLLHHLFHSNRGTTHRLQHYKPGGIRCRLPCSYIWAAPLRSCSSNAWCTRQRWCIYLHPVDRKPYTPSHIRKLLRSMVHNRFHRSIHAL